MVLSFQAYSGRSGSCSQLRVIFSFYAATIVSALDAVDKVSDTIISKLLPYVQKVSEPPSVSLILIHNQNEIKRRIASNVMMSSSHRA